MMIALVASLALSADCTVISGAREVFLPAGPQADVTLVIDGARIAAVGAVAFDPIDSGARWNGRNCAHVLATGGAVTAGLVEARSQLGITEIDLEESTRDLDGGGDPIRAALRIAEAYDPLSSVIGVQRSAGVTGAVIHPEGGFVAGTSAFVSLWGESQDETVVQAVAAMEATGSWGPSRASDLLGLRELLDDARAWRANQAAFERNATRAFAASRSDLAALLDVVDGRIPLVVGADRAADIEALLRFREEQRIRLVIVGAAEGWRVADRLAAAGVPVVVDPMVFGPGSVDQLAGRADNAALLSAAGVAVTISTFGTHNARNLRQYAGNAVRAGMDRALAVAAITSRPLEAFGIAGRGRLVVGAPADLVVWSGDPLELSTLPVGVWIGGASVPLESRQTALRDKYRQLPK